jgi:hypothetical protein
VAGGPQGPYGGGHPCVSVDLPPEDDVTCIGRRWG